MNDLKIDKEKKINNYISNKILKEELLDINLMKEELSMIIGEKPGIELDYKSENLILENGKDKKNIKKLDSITIYYTYVDNNQQIRFDTLKYLTD